VVSFTPRPLYLPVVIITVIKSRIRCTGQVARMEEMSILDRKPEEERQLGRHRRKWKDNSRLYLRERRWKVVK